MMLSNLGRQVVPVCHRAPDSKDSLLLISAAISTLRKCCRCIKVHKVVENEGKQDADARAG
jgi:hypothetical protein